MIVYQSKQNIYTDKDYAPDSLTLENLRLDFEEKDFILEREDFVCYVPGSMTLLELDSILEKHGFLFNYSGPAEYSISRILGEHSYNLSSLVLGLDLYHSDQSLSKTGGKVIKNVSGYDLAKLYLGSFNSFGIIIGAYLRLEKQPECQVSIKVSVDQKHLAKEFYEFISETSFKTQDLGYKSQILIYKQEDQSLKLFFETKIFGEGEMLDLKTSKTKQKFKEIFADYEILEHREKFHKDYNEPKNLFQIFSRPDKLKTIVEFLLKNNHCHSMKIFPGEAMIEVISNELLAKAIIKRFSKDIFLEVLPKNQRNIKLQKQYQKKNNYEQSIIKKLKAEFDPKNLLNPGLL